MPPPPCELPVREQRAAGAAKGGTVSGRGVGSERGSLSPERTQGRGAALLDGHQPHPNTAGRSNFSSDFSSDEAMGLGREIPDSQNLFAQPRGATALEPSGTWRGGIMGPCAYAPMVGNVHRGHGFRALRPFLSSQRSSLQLEPFLKGCLCYSVAHGAPCLRSASLSIRR